MKNTKTLSELAQAIRRRKTRFWGQDYFITPRLVNWMEGDGRKVITFTPLATRPDRYVVRIDSKNDMEGDTFYDDTLEAIYNAIEDEFGEADEEWEADNGRTYRRHNNWPALNLSCGCSWGELLILARQDLRTEEAVRREISHAARPRTRIR